MREKPPSPASARAPAAAEVAPRVTAAEKALHSQRDFVENLLDTAASLIIAFDRDGRLICFNSACEQLTGYRADDVLGRSFYDFFIPADERDRVRDALAPVWAGDSPSHNDNHWLTRSGDCRLIAWSNTSLVDERGEVAYVVASGLDITDRVAAEQSSRISEQRLRMTLDAARLATWEYDPATDELWLDWSEGHAVYLGLELATVPVTWSDFLELVHDDDRGRVAAEVAAAIRGTAVSYTVSFRYRKPDGEVRWREATGHVVRDASGAAVRVLGVTQDTTDRHRSDEAARRADAILVGVGSVAQRLLGTRFEDCAPEIVERIGLAAAVSRAWIMRVQQVDGRPVLTMLSEWTAPGLPSTYAAWQGFVGPPAWFEPLERGDVYEVHVAAKTGELRCLLEAEQIDSTLEAPVFVAGELWGLIGFEDCVGGRTWSGAEREALRVAASTIGTALSRELAEGTRRASDERLRLALRAARMNTWEWDEAARRYHRFAVSDDADVDALGTTFEDFLAGVHPDDREAVEVAFRDALERGTSYEIEFRLVEPDGTVRWRASSGRVVLGEGARRVAGVTYDVTERRQQEEALRRRDAALEAVSRAARLLLEQGLDDCGAEVLAVLGEALGASRVYVFEHERRLEGRLAVMRAEWCAPGVASDWWEELILERDGFGRWLAEWQAGRAIHGAVRELPEHGLLAGSGIRSIADVPIFVDGELWGDIGFDDCVNERAWSTAELDALRAAADILGAAIGRQGAEAALRESEALLRQAQKMEAVGRLAGGIAHDFNNLLTVITGNTSCLLDEPGLSASAAEGLGDVQLAAAKAAVLTRQLLAFSRKQVLQPRLLDLGGVLRELERILGRMIGEDVALEITVPDAPVTVLADRGQIEQVVLNLAVNARDAMPDGGSLSISTDRIELDSTDASRLGVVAGAYALLEVRDSGAGMDAETVSRIFEPFFTTKGSGQGTGLGLATVHGIVEQSDGTIAVWSEPSVGTTFTVYFPFASESAASTDGGAEGEPAHGSETVLIVEDDESVRALVSKVLRRAGYRVVAAATGREAADVLEHADAPIALVVTDVVMPGMSGGELGARIEELVPGLPVLYISGYTDDAIVRHGVVSRGMPLLEKPFTPVALLARVRETIDSRHPLV